jgi:hypothetical protein
VSVFLRFTVQNVKEKSIEPFIMEHSSRLWQRVAANLSLAASCERRPFKVAEGKIPTMNCL